MRFDVFDDANLLNTSFTAMALDQPVDPFGFLLRKYVCVQEFCRRNSASGSTTPTSTSFFPSSADCCKHMAKLFGAPFADTVVLDGTCQHTRTATIVECDASAAAAEEEDDGNGVLSISTPHVALHVIRK